MITDQYTCDFCTRPLNTHDKDGQLVCLSIVSMIKPYHGGQFEIRHLDGTYEWRTRVDFCSIECLMNYFKIHRDELEAL